MLVLSPSWMVAALATAATAAIAAERPTTMLRDQAASEANCPAASKPRFDQRTEVAVCLGGKWYVGPLGHFGSLGRAGFWWWDHKPVPSHQPTKAVQELNRDGKGDYPAIALLLTTYTREPVPPSKFKQLQALQAANRVSERSRLHDGLERWRIRVADGVVHTWYVATALKEPEGDPPVLSCSGESAAASCGSGFRWHSGITVGMNFKGIHAADWPAIYQETIKVLTLLKSK